MTIIVRQDGARVSHTPTSALAAGVGVMVGPLFGVTTQPIAEKEEGSIVIAGVVELEKLTGKDSAIRHGAPVFFDVSLQKAHAVAGEGLTRIGVATELADESATTVLVHLQPLES